MYQSCISRERVIQSLDDVESVCETGNGTGVHPEMYRCTQVAFCPSLAVSSLGTTPSDDLTYCSPAGDAPPKACLYSKFLCMCLFVGSKVRPVRLKLPILRFHGEEVTIPTTHLTPFIHYTYNTPPFDLGGSTESSALSVIHILSTISQVLTSQWRLA
jgi:hypothetical protein